MSDSSKLGIISTPEIQTRSAPRISGRVRGLAAAVREVWTAEALRDAYTEIAVDPKASRRDKLEALRWLTERGYGKVPETHLISPVSDEHRETLAELSRDQLLALVDSAPPSLPADLSADPGQAEVEAEVVPE